MKKGAVTMYILLCANWVRPISAKNTGEREDVFVTPKMPCLLNGVGSIYR